MKISTILLVAFTAIILWNRFGPSMVDTTEIDFSQAVIIDVRSPGEFTGGHVEGAINLPIDTITEADVLKLTSKEKPVILYCRSGGRASAVQSRMEQWGFTSVYNLKTQSGVESALQQ